jgi:FkbM family methyltransferase
VGSAADLYTAVLSRLAGPVGQVHSIEPLPFAHLLWARLLNARRACNVRHHCLALGAEAGSGPMSVPVGSYGLVTGRSYLMRQTAGPGSNAEFAGQVPVIVTVDRLDDFCAREAIGQVDFVKVDVEGAELQVLEGGKGVIETHRPAMLIEIEARHTARYGHSPEDVSGWLLQRGYTMHTWRRGWREARRVEPGIRNYLFRARASGKPDNSLCGQLEAGQRTSVSWPRLSVHSVSARRQRHAPLRRPGPADAGPARCSLAGLR